MLFLYNLPSFWMASIVVGTTVLCVLLGYALFRRLAPLHLDADEKAMTISMVSVVTTINSLLVAFAAISVWDAYNDANRTVTAEAACAGELAHDLDSLKLPSAVAANLALQRYVDRVIHVEWPLMQQQARTDPGADQAFNQMFYAANRIEPGTPRQNVLLQEVLARVNEMVKYRQQRILTLDEAMPATLWGVIIIVSALSFGLLYVLPANRFHITLISIWATTLGLSFFFVLAVDRPFAGEVSVSTASFQQTMADLIHSGVWAGSTAP